MEIVETGDISVVRPLFEQWLLQSKGGDYGVDMDLAVLEQSLQYLLETGSRLLVAVDEQAAPLGWMCISKVPSFMGPQMLANVTFWFASDHSKLAGPKLVQAAKLWTVQNGCSHLMLGASRLAGSSHDSICRYCDWTGAKQIETIYLWECQ